MWNRGVRCQQQVATTSRLADQFASAVLVSVNRRGQKESLMSHLVISDMAAEVRLVGVTVTDISIKGRGSAVSTVLLSDCRIDAIKLVDVSLRTARGFIPRLGDAATSSRASLTLQDVTILDASLTFTGRFSTIMFKRVNRAPGLISRSFHRQQCRRGCNHGRRHDPRVRQRAAHRQQHDAAGLVDVPRHHFRRGRRGRLSNCHRWKSRHPR